MNRRKGLLLASLGLLPALSAFGYGQTLTSAAMATTTADPYVTFAGGFTVGWDLKKNQLVIKAGGKEARFTPEQIMEALNA